MQNYRNGLSLVRNQCFSGEAIRDSVRVAVSDFTTEIDKIIIGVFDLFIPGDQVCLVALGGYGRKELCPHSDIDILLLHEGDHKKESIARLVRNLWDMGFPLGCVVRSIGESRGIMGEDLATDTALLEARYLAGDKALFDRLESSVIYPYFTGRKKWFLNEMAAAFRGGLNETESGLYVVEPNLKNGICALRDCQRLVWAMRVAEKKFGEHDGKALSLFSLDKSNKYPVAYETLLGMRCSLHMVAQRRIDVLEFSYQQQVAQMLGFGEQGAGALMERFFRTVSDVRNCILIYLEQSGSSGSLLKKARAYFCSVHVEKKIRLLDGILYQSGELPFEGTDPLLWILGLYNLSIKYKASLSVGLEQLIRSITAGLSDSESITPLVASAFRLILSSKAPIGSILGNMHETGVLKLLIPAFERLRCKVEYDSYHEFTVDQHSMIALRLFDKLDSDNDPELQEIKRNQENLFQIRLAILLHDIGKSVPGNHAYNGAVIASNICDRLGADEIERETVEFLILHHLELSRLAFHRMPEAHTLKEFAQRIGTRERLDLLYLITVLDVRGVGGKTWTAWKGMQLQAVYHGIKEELEGKTADGSNPVIDEIWPKINSQTQSLVDKLDSETDLVIDAETFGGFERLTVCGFDRTHFFADIVGCISSEGYNILAAHIMTTPEGRVFDIFHVEPDASTRISTQMRILHIYGKWKKIMAGEITAGKLISERFKLYPPKTQRAPTGLDSEVLFDNTISREYTVIEVRSPDRFGLLYRITHRLSSNQINIVSAKLSTQLSLARDVFYVNGQGGSKIEDTAIQEKIRHTLLSALNRDDEF